MKTYFFTFPFVVLLFTSTPLLQSQTRGFHIWPTVISRMEMVGYTFFSGDDAADFKTSVKGFGSGFWDTWNSRNSLELVAVGFEKAYLSSGVGLTINKYRFSDNLLFTKDPGTGMISWTHDLNPTHDYVNTFFGYGKSKWVQASLYIPLYLNVMLGENLQVSGGGFIDFPFYSKYKMKYLQDGEKVKELIEPAVMKDYPLTTPKFGIHAGIYHEEWKTGIGATYYLSALFVDGMGPDLHEWRISLMYAIDDIKKQFSEMKTEMADGQIRDR